MTKIFVCFAVQASSPEWDKTGDSSEVVLRTWEVESPHNYENNQHITQIFSSPGASSFLVEFDPRCQTEKRWVVCKYLYCPRDNLLLLQWSP